LGNCLLTFVGKAGEQKRGIRGALRYELLIEKLPYLLAIASLTTKLKQSLPKELNKASPKYRLNGRFWYSHPQKTK
jgi:hypothetical protein